QGIFCLGCTWAIMAVMFAVGVMNVIWMAILGVLMGIEKMVPNIWVTRGIGIFLIVWGLLIFTISDAGRTLLGIG
ncbi:MAG TPA: metal-binding protein, partial [Rhizobiales bacterium]|nr:metal-binding protein [Hyphomicrobiales bacterium]